LRRSEAERIQKLETIAGKNIQSAIDEKEETFRNRSDTRNEISTFGGLEITQVIPAHLAVDTAGRKPEQPRGLRLVALFSAERGFQ
jgi:hypothetical protein